MQRLICYSLDFYKMKKKMQKYLILLFLMASVVQAQETYKPNNVFRIFSENDFWNFGSKTDIYFTQGLKIEWLHPLSKKSFLQNSIFTLCEDSENAIGYSIGQNLYTSSDITVSELMEGDRPYSAWTYISSFLISNDYCAKRRLTSEIYLGVIGPMAQGEFIQREFHELIDSPDPKGWDNQIANDVGINFMLRYELPLIDYQNKQKSFSVAIIPFPEVQLGTVFNNVGLGMISKISFINSSSYFSNPFNDPGSINKAGDRTKKTNANPTLLKAISASSLSIFGRPVVRGVLYNALLQGGVFNRDSSYFISDSDMRRFYLNMEYGITWSTPYWDLSFSKALRTKEFDFQARHHEWGQIYLTVKL